MTGAGLPDARPAAVPEPAAAEAPSPAAVSPLTLLAPAGVTCEGDSCSF